MIRTPANILVVDDEIVVAMTIEDSLQRLNYRVAGISTSGEEALALSRETEPDLVLMDIGLAGDMDGIETATIMHEQCRIPVIFLTGRSDSESISKALDSQPYGYLLKPVNEAELTATIEIALYKHRAMLAEEEVRHDFIKLHVVDHTTQYEIYNKTIAICGYLDLARAGNPPGSLANPYLEKINQLIREIQHRIVFQEQFCKIGMKDEKWQDVNTLVQGARHPDTPIGFTYEVKTGSLEILADPLLSRVFSQLFENTIIHGKHATRIQISFNTMGNQGVLVISDDGCGITSREKPGLFSDKIEQARGKGLFLVKEILTISGMNIRETGVPDEGTRFEIYIPKGRYRFAHGEGDCRCI